MKIHSFISDNIVVKRKTRKVYENIKTGGKYIYLGKVVDSTNSRDGNFMVIYCSLLNNEIYVRDYKEFHEKFKLAEPKKTLYNYI